MVKSLLVGDAPVSGDPAGAHRNWFVRHWQGFTFFTVFAVGVILRLYDFPAIPAGVNQDELSAGYESWSLLLYGTDRWGAHLPAYFLSWGSGMNVLYSYLSIPFIALFGLTTLAIRAVAMIFGVLMLPLMYVTVKRWHGVKVALASMGLVAVIPWGFMTARWGLESNLLPFFLLLGVWSFSVGISAQARRWQRIVALLPFGVALYAYGLGLPTIGVMLVLFACRYRREIRAHWRSWLISLLLMLVVACPFLLFVLKAYVLKAPLPFEQALPFSLPTLTQTRLDQVGGSAITSFHALLPNIWLLDGGFADPNPWNTLAVSPPIPIMVIVLFLVDIVIGVIRSARDRRRPKLDVFDLWLLACVPLFCLIPLDLNQGNAIYVPLLVVAARGMQRILLRIRAVPWRVTAAVIAGLLILVPSGIGYRYYVDGEYTSAESLTLHPGLGQALQTAQQIAHGQPLYVTGNMQLAYMQTLWYLHIPAKVLQQGTPVADATNGTRDFENIHFEHVDNPNLHGYYFFGIGAEKPLCADYTVIKQPPGYNIGYCK